MARLKKVSDDEYQLVCDCQKYVHSLTMKDGKPHVETMKVKGKDDEPDRSLQKKKGQSFEDWFSGSGKGNNTDSGDGDTDD